MQNTWLTLLPPIIVLFSALISRQITISLILGILSAALIANDFSIIPSIINMAKQVMVQLQDIENYYFVSLIFTLGILISLITKTGGIQAIGNIITKKAKSKKSAETSSIILSFLMFIDDYLSMLTVGHVMRPITDEFKIPRTKLAFLTATLAGCLAILIPITTWLGVIIGQLSASGISLEPAHKPNILADPFFVYLQSIPFVFYSIIVIGSIWFIVRKRISYGTMYEQEQIAKETGNLFGGRKPFETVETSTDLQKSSTLDFFVPILSLIGSILIGILYSGGFYILGGNNSLMKAFQSSNTPLVLFTAGLISLIVGFTFALLQKKVTRFELPQIINSGIKMMFSSVVLILLAWIFGAFLKQDLKTGQYLANLLAGALNINLLPFMIFIVSCAIGLAIGSSWGTIAMMIPIIIPMIISLSSLQTPVLIDNIIILFPCLGAVFSGALAGNHLSPISDSTIIASTTVGAYTTDLLKIRFIYTMPAVIAAAVAFLISGFLINKNYYLSLILSITIGFLISLSILVLCQYFNKKNKI